MAKHIIIGCGSAGLSAVEKIRSLNQEDEIKVVSMEDCLPYSPTALPYLLAGKVQENDIWVWDEEYFDKMKVTFARGQEVTQLLPDKKQVVYRDGDVDGYDNLLIASGSESAALPIKGLASSLSFHTLADYHRLLGMLDGKAAVAVLGAGLVGMELAIALSLRGHRMTVIEKEPRLLPLYFDEPLTTYITDVFHSHQVETLTGEEVIEVRRDGDLTEIACASGKVLRPNLLVSCVGVQPRVSFLDGSGAKLNQGILVDSRMRTNLEGVYAAGDVAEAPDFFYNQPGINAIIPSAVAQGKVAGANMAGSETNYEGWVSMNIFNIFGNLACSIGLSMLGDKETEVLEEKDDEKRYFKRLIFRDNRLIGAMFLNVDVMPGVIRYLIENRIDLGQQQELLLAKPKETSCWLMLEAEKTLAER